MNFVPPQKAETSPETPVRPYRHTPLQSAASILGGSIGAYGGARLVLNPRNPLNGFGLATALALLGGAGTYAGLRAGARLAAPKNEPELPPKTLTQRGGRFLATGVGGALGATFLPDPIYWGARRLPRALVGRTNVLQYFGAGAGIGGYLLGRHYNY